MAKANETHSFQGMVKDTKESLLEPKYYIDAHNIRVTTREDNPQQYIITNEKGTTEYPISVKGTILGYCVVSHYLTIFSTTRTNKTETNTDYIYRINLNTLSTAPSIDKNNPIILFNGDLNFSKDHPIETLGSYEDKLICKVYWTDNHNQPRLINILKPELKGYNLDTFSPSLTLPSFYTADSFNFVRELQLREVVSVNRIEGGSGMFSPGTIQYAFTYYNKYEQETNIFYITPLYYTSFPDRGGNGEDRVSNCFKILVNNIDLNFEYLRIYSIQRTSLNGTPIVKRVTDINISNFRTTDSNKPFYEDFFLEHKDAEENVTPIDLVSEQSDEPIQFDRGYYISNASTVNIKYTLNSKEFSLYLKDYKVYSVLKDAGIIREYYTYQTGANYSNDSKGECLFGSYVKYYVINPKLNNFQLTKYKEYIKHVNNLPEWFPFFKETSGDTALLQKLEETLKTWRFNIENYNFIFKENTETSSYNNIYVIKQYIAGGGAFDHTEDFKGICTSDTYLFYVKPSSSSSTPPSNSYYQVSFIDTGTVGDIIDPQRLLYIGGEEIRVETLDQKDGTLFLGNLNIERPSIRSLRTKDDKPLQDYLQSILVDSSGNKAINSGIRELYHTISVPTNVDSNGIVNLDLTNYIYKNQLFTNTSGFKSNEYYRLGIQFQYKTGKWSDPIYLDDIKQLEVPSQEVISTYGTQYIKQSIPTFTYKLPYNVMQTLYNCGYRKARGVVVFPKLEERSIIAQGIVNPTMYTKKQRKDSLYAQSSWFFRPIFIGKNHVVNKYNNTHTLDNQYLFGHRTDEEKSSALEVLESNTSDDSSLKEKTGGVVVANYDKINDTKLKYIGNNYNNKRDDEGSVTTDEIQYADIPTRDVEIQGSFTNENQFYIDWSFLTFHSPDIQFDDQLYFLDYNHIKARQIGYVKVNSTYSDISLITKTGPINTFAAGFDHKSFIFKDGLQLCSGLFYEDGLIDENKKTGLYLNAKGYFGNNPFRFMVYPFQGAGSLNNDSDREGSTSKLQTKIISNLRICDSILKKNAYTIADNKLIDSNDLPLLHTMQLDYTTQPQILKFDTKVYQSNIDTMLIPNYKDGIYFISSKASTSKLSPLEQTIAGLTFQPGYSGTVQVDFKNHNNASFYQDLYWYKTWDWAQLNAESGQYLLQSWQKGKNSSNQDVVGWYNTNSGSQIGDSDVGLTMKKSPVRMKYKSTPHMVMPLSSKLTPIDYDTLQNDAALDLDKHFTYLPIVELYRDYEHNTEQFSKSTLFGGKSEDALKANMWIPASDPIALDLDNRENKDGITIEYKYGDTWYQRFDCLKTYAYTLEDQNQIIDILSFPCETRINIDGRYDRNRGQKDNTTMHPTNFNLINTVYSQQDNYFTYRILDDDFYKINHFPNQFTWTLEKHSGEEVDPWTNLTLASTFDVDGSKGQIQSIRNWSNNLYCFQDRSISRINFNAQVQVETKQGSPIEIINNKRVNGIQTLGEDIGSINKFSICNSANAIYFIDSITNNLWKIEGSQNPQIVPVSLSNMSTWFNVQKNLYWTPNNWNKSMRLYFDESNKDLYISTNNECLCFSASINSFISFFPYSALNCMFTYNDNFYALKNDTVNNKLYQLFTGEYNSFFGEYKPYDITLVSNGYSTQQPAILNDKVFDVFETRADYFEYTDTTSKYTLQDDIFPFDTIKVWNNYQDTEDVKLEYKKILPSNLKKKFRIWRIQIPRNKIKINGKVNDRIRDIWCKIKLSSPFSSSSLSSTNFRIEMNDAVVTYFT